MTRITLRRAQAAFWRFCEAIGSTFTGLLTLLVMEFVLLVWLFAVLWRGAFHALKSAFRLFFS